MRCEEIQTLLSAGLDGEIDAAGQGRMEHHLQSCSVCAAEQEALSATIRLLRALPEADPPLELRGRIATALMEAHRRSQRRWLNLGWLARPQTAGWAWGAAMGAVVATVGLIATHAPGPSRSVVVAPPRSSPRFTPPASSLNPPQTRVADGSLGRANPPSADTKAMPPASGMGDEQSKLPAIGASPRIESIVGPPVLKPEARRPATASGKELRLQPSRDPMGVEKPTSPQTLQEGNPVSRPTTRVVPRIGRGEPGALESTPADRSEPAPAPDPAAVEDPVPSVSPGTAGMTQMASGVNPMESPDVVTDDLVELRRRLIDRPLEVPELGVMKPTRSLAASSEGWIRF